MEGISSVGQAQTKEIMLCELTSVPLPSKEIVYLILIVSSAEAKRHTTDRFVLGF
jgi:hypothetical protein